MLMVSYCGQSMSVVRRAASTIALKAYSSYTPGPIDSILGRKHRGDLFVCLFVCVEVLRPSQPNGVMSSAVSLPNHTFTGQA